MERSAERASVAEKAGQGGRVRDLCPTAASGTSTPGWDPALLWGLLGSLSIWSPTPQLVRRSPVPSAQDRHFSPWREGTQRQYPAPVPCCVAVSGVGAQMTEAELKTLEGSCAPSCQPVSPGGWTHSGLLLLPGEAEP